MLEINVNIHFPDLPAILEAIKTIAAPKAVPKPAAASPAPAENVSPKVVEFVPPAPEAPVAPTVAPAAPVAPTVAPAAPAAPTAPTTPTVAPTAAPSYTLPQVARAGADLLTSNPALQPQLVELLRKYGAGTVQELPADKLGAFAADLRGMGAKI